MIDINCNSFSLTVNDDRYNLQCKIFQQYGITPPQKFVGTTKLGHIRGCKEGHKQIISLAIKKQLPYCVVFEDDAYPCDNCIQKFQQIMSNIDASKIHWDMLMIGICGEHSSKFVKQPESEKLVHQFVTPIFGSKDYTYEQAKQTKNVVDVSNDLIAIHKYPHGTQSYIIKQNMYQFFLDHLSKNNNTPTDYLCGYDNLLPYKTYVTKKMLFCQRFKHNKKYSWWYPYFYNIEECQFGPLHDYSNTVIPVGFSDYINS